MSNMTPAYCAKQLGHSVEIFLKTYAKWLDGDQDCWVFGSSMRRAIGRPRPAKVKLASQTPATCIGTHSLNDPAWPVPAWLQHLTRHGTAVAVGTRVTTGSWVGCMPIPPDDRVSIDFAGLGNQTVWP